MDPSIDDVLGEILKVRSSLHGAGTVSDAVLQAIVQETRGRKILRSLETGCGATTLLLSHLSDQHTVFTIDEGGSLENVRRSRLLRRETVRFVEGPTQVTLPRHAFGEKLQIAVIDGPHAYPFPDIEYYFIYPHLDRDALLIVDDIHIPTVHNLFQFLKRDDMFQLTEVIRSTAFFTRTDAPTFSPTGDGWYLQQYNRRTLLRYDWRSRLVRFLPRALSARLLRQQSNSARRNAYDERFAIESPRRNERVGAAGVVQGRAVATPDTHLWVLIRRQDQPGWWLQGNGPVSIVDGKWSLEVRFGEDRDAGHVFEIAAVLIGTPIHEQWLASLAKPQGRSTQSISFPDPAEIVSESAISVRKRH